jgi:hypothetical protein
MDDDLAYRISIRLFEKIALQNYDDRKELRALLESAFHYCFPTGETHRRLLLYVEALDKLDAGVYYVDVVVQLSDNIFHDSTLFPPLVVASKAKKHCCVLL